MHLLFHSVPSNTILIRIRKKSGSKWRAPKYCRVALRNKLMYYIVLHFIVFKKTFPHFVLPWDWTFVVKWYFGKQNIFTTNWKIPLVIIHHACFIMTVLKNKFSKSIKDTMFDLFTLRAYIWILKVACESQFYF